MQPSAADRSARGRNFSGRGGRRHEIERAGAEGGGGAAAACHGIPRYENNGALSGLGDGSAGNAVDFAQRRRQELAEQHPKALRPPKLLHVKTAVQEQRSSTPQAFLRRRGHRDVRRSKVDRARVEQQLPRAAVPASARLRRDVDTAEPAQRSSFAAARAAEIRAFTPVVPPRGRAAPSVLRLRGDERRVAVTRGFLRRRVAAKWGFLRRRCRLRWQESTVSRRRFERRAYRASVPPKVAAPAGPAVPAAARYQRQHFSERGYKFFFFFFTFYSNLYAHRSSGTPDHGSNGGDQLARIGVRRCRCHRRAHDARRVQDGVLGRPSDATFGMKVDAHGALADLEALDARAVVPRVRQVRVRGRRRLAAPWRRRRWRLHLSHRELHSTFPGLHNFTGLVAVK